MHLFDLMLRVLTFFSFRLIFHFEPDIAIKDRFFTNTLIM